MAIDVVREAGVPIEVQLARLALPPRHKDLAVLAGPPGVNGMVGEPVALLDLDPVAGAVGDQHLSLLRAPAVVRPDVPDPTLVEVQLPRLPALVPRDVDLAVGARAACADGVRGQRVPALHGH